MPIFRTTWFFKREDYGWTENFHHLGTDYTVLRAAVDTLAPFRKAILSQDVKLIGVRISDDDVFRDSEFRQNPPVYGPGTYPGTSDPIFTSLLTRWDSSPTVRKNLYLRGIQDDLIVAGQFFNDPVWQPRWTAYKNAVMLNGFAIKSLGGPAAPMIGVLNIDNTGLVTTATPHSFIAGNRVHFTNVKTVPRLPTTMLVTLPITSFSFSLVNWGGRPAVFPTSGRVRLYNFQVLPIAAGTWERIVKKSTGRPFGLPVGRRKRVK